MIINVMVIYCVCTHFKQIIHPGLDLFPYINIQGNHTDKSGF